MFVAPGEPAGVQQRITRLHRAGCGVIILTPKGYAGLCKYTDCQVTEAASPADAIDAIARAATRAPTRALTASPPREGRTAPPATRNEKRRP